MPQNEAESFFGLADVFVPGLFVLGVSAAPPPRVCWVCFGVLVRAPCLGWHPVGTVVSLRAPLAPCWHLLEFPGTRWHPLAAIHPLAV